LFASFFLVAGLMVGSWFSDFFLEELFFTGAVLVAISLAFKTYASASFFMPPGWDKRTTSISAFRVCKIISLVNNPENHPIYPCHDYRRGTAINVGIISGSDTGSFPPGVTF
jgi:hypothetical protein